MAYSSKYFAKRYFASRYFIGRIIAAVIGKVRSRSVAVLNRMFSIRKR